ncbi:MAG: hypothetical protein K0S45_2967 [Nitrospira sp.]|nr:hypothetical protein [Nitrospira sp.]
MTAVVGVRLNFVIRAYQRLCAKGSVKMVTLSSCMRKWLAIFNAMQKEQRTEWREESGLHFIPWRPPLFAELKGRRPSSRRVRSGPHRGRP